MCLFLVISTHLADSSGIFLLFRCWALTNSMEPGGSMPRSEGPSKNPYPEPN